ncbi:MULTISPECIES: uroporphyrinogen-III synthase [unclassified Nitratiruptor]|uniref:uroporphyrinogen-III synthase n=1 Tax=unclassified Nitratiruptor TaxID=2624044 RepID=UPI0019153DD8|nr:MULTISPECIES: uroporphyrinogen-III synthase [unclassified Nitratiruptor]BCD60645.1 uroporphyrinogen-III synthase [Nitratiruptor sp. YY08-10]BCD64576.1 uroporphyrinogen-III synthase [Nitratiruptor sp. YY08-14]
MPIYILSNTKIEGAKTLPLIEQKFLPISIDFSLYDYLIFTSKNGVRAIEQISHTWRLKPVISIGSATTKAIKKKGGKVVWQGSEGYGDTLANEIVAHFSNDKKYLYIRPKKVVSNLVPILRQNGFEIDEVIAYETVCRACDTVQKPEPGSVIIFSSPSTVECFFRCFAWDDSYKAVVIGKQTAQALPKEISYVMAEKKSLVSCVETAKTLLS